MPASLSPDCGHPGVLHTRRNGQHGTSARAGMDAPRCPRPRCKVQGTLSDRRQGRATPWKEHKGLFTAKTDLQTLRSHFDARLNHKSSSRLNLTVIPAATSALQASNH